MKRRELLRHLNGHGCVLLREGGNHSWWSNPEKNKRSAAANPGQQRLALLKKSGLTQHPGDFDRDLMVEVVLPGSEVI